MEGEWQWIVKQEHSACRSSSIKEVFKPLDRRAAVVYSYDNFCIPMAGKMSEWGEEMPSPGSFHERDSRPEVAPGSLQIPLEMIAESHWSRRLEDELNIQVNDRRSGSNHPRQSPVHVDGAAGQVGSRV